MWHTSVPIKAAHPCQHCLRTEPDRCDDLNMDSETETARHCANPRPETAQSLKRAIPYVDAYIRECLLASYSGGPERRELERVDCFDTISPRCSGHLCPLSPVSDRHPHAPWSRHRTRLDHLFIGGAKLRCKRHREPTYGWLSHDLPARSSTRSRHIRQARAQYDLCSEAS